jgi:parallel beta-helix repeat protein
MKRFRKALAAGILSLGLSYGISEAQRVILPSDRHSAPRVLDRNGPPCAAPHGGAAAVMNSWVVDADQTIENRTLTLNGTLEIRRGTLTLRNVALEINATPNSPPVSGSVVAIDIAPGAGLALSGVRIAATSVAAGTLRANRAAAVTAESTCFSHMAASISSTGRVSFRNNEFTLAGTDGVVALTLTNSSAALVEANTIRFALDPQTGSVPKGAGGIYLFFIHVSTILRNTIVGAVNGISLWGSWNNRVAANTWNGPMALTPVRANTPNWWSMSTPGLSGEAGISLSWWSNNNIIEQNTLMGAQSAVLFVLQSTNDTISKNIITGAGYGITLRWASHILIDGNEIRDVYSDAVHAYRSHDVAVTNNHIYTSGSGVSFYACADNTVKSNVLVDSDRGIFLHSSSYTTIDGNAVSGAVQGIFVASSSDNMLTNNTIAADSAGWDDGTNNSWAGNYWPSDAPSIIPPGAAADTAPASGALAYTPAPVTPLTPLPFKEPLNSVTTIRDVQVWRGHRR